MDIIYMYAKNGISGIYIYINIYIYIERERERDKWVERIS